ncbi:MAG: acyloxyacyl hydrolase [Bacteroidales bacterium]|nr:acyloxyacyl hydrolase [Bacteroidales bacterium]
MIILISKRTYFQPLLLYAFIFSFACLNISYSQNESQEKSTFIIGIRSHYGFIIPHSKSVTEISGTNPACFEIDFNWHLKSRNVWQYCYCYPRTGFSVFYVNYMNPDVLGSSVSIIPFIEPFINTHRKISWSVRFGIGPAYMTTVYDEETNPANKFYSTHLSYIALLNFGMNYRMNERLNFRLAGNWNHISNGGLKSPNAGINFPTVNVGMDYSFTPALFEERYKDPSIVVNPQKNRYDFIFLGTAKKITRERDRSPVFGVSVNYSRVVGRISAISFGAEWISDHSKKDIIRRDIITNDNGEYLDYHRCAFLVGHELLLGRFIFYQQLGIYFYAPYKAMDPVYQRYGLSYILSKHLYIGINIKAHRHVADFMDLRLGMFF